MVPIGFSDGWMEQQSGAVRCDAGERDGTGWNERIRCGRANQDPPIHSSSFSSVTRVSDALYMQLHKAWHGVALN